MIGRLLDGDESVVAEIIEGVRTDEKLDDVEPKVLPDDGVLNTVGVTKFDDKVMELPLRDILSAAEVATEELPPIVPSVIEVSTKLLLKSVPLLDVILSMTEDAEKSLLNIVVIMAILDVELGAAEGTPPPPLEVSVELMIGVVLGAAVETEALLLL